MPEEAYRDLVYRLLRDHEGYTGDAGQYPLPIGNPSTARKPITKRDLRELLLIRETSADEAMQAAAAAQEAASDAIAAAASGLLSLGRATRVSVVEFGVIGDGSTNDTAAMQAALDSSSRNRLYVPDGLTVYTRAPLRLRQGTDLLLAKSARIRRHVAGSEQVYMFVNMDFGDLSTSGYGGTGDITISGGALDFTATSTGGITAAIGYCVGFTMRGVTVTGWRNRHMVDLCAVKDASFIECLIANPSYVGSTDLTLSEAIQIDSATSSAFPPGGVADNTPCENVLVQGCTFRGVATAVGTHHAAANRHRGVRVVNNFIDGTLSDAIRARHWQGAAILGNTIINAAGRAAEIRQNIGSVFDGNTIIDPATGGGVSAVFVNNSDRSVFGKGNTVSFTATPSYTHAVEIGSSGNPATDTVVEIGALQQGTLTTVNDNGTRTMINGAIKINLADQTAASVPLPVGQTGQSLVAISSSAASSGSNPIGIFYADCDSSPNCTNVALRNTTGVVFTTGALTGNTGTNGNFTLSAGTDGRIYLENRSGAARNMTVAFITPGA